MPTNHSAGPEAAQENLAHTSLSATPDARVVTIPSTVEFDDSAFRAKFLEKRRHPKSLNNLIDHPTLISLLGPLRGARVLEIGCGGGDFAAELIKGGAKSYVGIDVSRGMIEEAQRNMAGVAACRFEVTDVEVQPLSYEPFDKCVSGLAFHFLSDLPTVLCKINEALLPGGELVFSVRHPLRTSNPSGLQPDHSSWVVTDYFCEGVRAIVWHGHLIHLFHRTVSSISACLSNAGFLIETLKEVPAIASETLEDDKDHVAVPGFLFWKVVKRR